MTTADLPRHHDDVDDLTLEALAAPAWPGLESTWCGPWLLRAGAGWTGRANSVLPLGPVSDLDAILAQVRQWYAARGLPAMLQVPLPAARELYDALHTKGWTDGHGALVLTAPLPAVLAAVPAGDVHIEVAATPGPEWLSVYRYRGAELPPAAVELLRQGPDPDFALARVDGAPAAVARGVVSAGWMGIAAVEVQPAYRRRGLAQQLLRALAERAVDRGAHSGWLQVDPGNTPALRLYGGAGYTVHHSYRYVLAQPSS